MRISIIIRTYNEEKHLGQVLDSLKEQDYPNYEIIIVDSESNDKTLEIAKKNECKIVKIKKSAFNYSYASNVGIKNATGDIVCFLSGHSVPCKKNYLSQINRIFQNDAIIGCYGDAIPLSDAGLFESFYYRLGHLKNQIFFNREIFINQIKPGVLSCSNACIRKEFLEKHPFIEELGDGGEDVYEAFLIIQCGGKIVKSNKLLVKHSHGKILSEFKKEIKNWSVLYDRVLNFIAEKEKK